MDLIDIIKQERKIKNISQKQLAELLNVSQNAISSLERGRFTLSANDFVTLCNFLHIDMAIFNDHSYNSVQELTKDLTKEQLEKVISYIQFVKSNN